MSIDHVVIGVTRSDAGIYINCLQRGNYHLNETRFKLKNTPNSPLDLLALVSCEIWGNSRDVLIGNKFIARREGYSTFVLSEWEQVETAIKEWKSTREESRDGTD